MVADDEAAIADLVVRVMEAEGMPAKAVYGGASALREIESGAYDLAILDVMMPDLDGFEEMTQEDLEIFGDSWEA